MDVAGLTSTHLVLFVTALCIAAALVPLVRAALGTPRRGIGGAAVGLGAVGPLALFAPLGLGPLGLASTEPTQVLVLAAGALTLLSLGVYDDACRASNREKLLVQIVVVLALFAVGVRIHHIGDLVLEGWSSLPLTALWLLGVIQAVSWLGRLGSPLLLFITAVVCYALGELEGEPFLSATAAALGGAVLGASLMRLPVLGSSATFVVGYVIGVVGLTSEAHEETLLALAVPAAALALPLAWLRRLRSRGGHTTPAQAVDLAQAKLRTHTRAIRASTDLDDMWLATVRALQTIDAVEIRFELFTRDGLAWEYEARPRRPRRTTTREIALWGLTHRYGQLAASFRWTTSVRVMRERDLVLDVVAEAVIHALESYSGRTPELKRKLVVTRLRVP